MTTCRCVCVCVCVCVCFQHVQVQLELGHVALLRPEVTSDGRTHDWRVYVRASTQRGGAAAAPPGEQHATLQFIERVQFTLHETYDQHRRTVGM